MSDLLRGVNRRSIIAGALAMAVPAAPMAQERAMPMKHLSVDSTLRELLEHPAFVGFSRRLLPWDDRPYDDTMPLRRIGMLLPYHSAVSPDVVVAALNHMIDAVAARETIFHDIYSNAARAADTGKSHAGMLFFRGRRGAPFAIVAPGGGFAYVGSVHEGFPHAVEISRRGYNAFVLKYRAGLGGHVATQDLAAAISYILRNAASLGVGTEKYTLWGSSAGARMVAAIGTAGVAAFGGADVPKPAAIVMAYTGHSDFAPTDPPTFVVVGDNDGISPPAVMERRIAAMRRAGVDVDYRRYANVGHGFGVGTGTSAQGWVGDAVTFWERVSGIR